MQKITRKMALASMLGALALPALMQSVIAAPAVERPVVKARSLMTPAEQQAYKRDMRQARTATEKQQLQEKQYAQLRQRATERGMVMADPPAKRGNAAMRPETRNEKPPRPMVGGR